MSSKKKQMQQAREEARRHSNAAHATREQQLRITSRAEEQVSNWPKEFLEMAQRIEREGENAVPDHDRDLIANRVPRGEFTHRDGGSSVYPTLLGRALFSPHSDQKAEKGRDGKSSKP